MAKTSKSGINKLAILALILGLGLAAAVVALRTVRYNPEVSRWKQLEQSRKENVVFQSMPAIQTFMAREFGPMENGESPKLLPEIYFGAYGDNTYRVTACLADKNNVVARGAGTFFFHDWSPKAASSEINLDLQPKFIASLKPSRMKTLLQTAQEKESATATFGDVLAEANKQDGKLWLTMRFTHPSRWLVDIPPMDRGYQEKMELEVVPSLQLLARKKIFKDGYTLFATRLPSTNPPDANVGMPVGFVQGYMHHLKKPILLPIEYNVSSSMGRGRDVTYEFEFSNSEHGEKPLVSQEEWLSFLRPEILSKAASTMDGPEGTYVVDGITVFIQTVNQQCSLRVTVPENYPFPTFER